MVQDIGVAVIVLGAVAFLIRHFFGGPGKPKATTTFVPLSKLKQKPPNDHCH